MDVNATTYRHDAGVRFRRFAALACLTLAACVRDIDPLRPQDPDRTLSRVDTAAPVPEVPEIVTVKTGQSLDTGGIGNPLVPLLALLEDPPSHGGSITFQSMGAAGWYPSRRDPASGSCDAINTAQCCMTKHVVADAGISPWDEELILTLRGPMLVKQLAVYQPQAAGATWDRVSFWENGKPGQGIGFQGDATLGGTFTGSIGNKCLVDVSTDRKFPCGPGSVPYCPANSVSQKIGWEGSKLILIQAAMPHFGDPEMLAVKNCSTDPKDNWFDAPWIGLSHGELVRSGKFGGCHCYAKDPAKWELADGCGQFNVFETVNDQNGFANLDLFSTNFFGYQGYVGEGPCGKECDIRNLLPAADLVDKSDSQEGDAAVASPAKGPRAAFRRPAKGYRWFVILMDAKTRTVQLALAHPGNLPAALMAMAVPPSQVPRSAIDALVALRLPAPPTASLRH